MPPPPNQAKREAVLAAWEKHGGNACAVARELGIHRATVNYYIRKLSLRRKPLAGGQIRGIRAKKQRSGTYILTSAQNNTHIHRKFWDNLVAYADFRGAQILIGTYSYNVNAYGPLSVKRNHARVERNLWYDPEIEPYFADERFEIAPGLIWAGEQNIMPTAVRPLSGLETYTRTFSGIFPHPKLALESVPTPPNSPAKLNFTTGSVTQRNYIAKNTGFRASETHAYSALIVEVTKSGKWFVRQLEADEEGVFCDLEWKVSGGKCKRGQWVEAINWGDVHATHLELAIRRICWDKGGILDHLRPKYQFFHDILDFYARNHWDIGNHHRMFERFVEGKDSVEAEIAEVVDFLRFAGRKWCKSVVVDSNHDNALERWLRDANFKTDPLNAEFYLEAQLAKYRAMRAQNERFHLVEWSCRRAQCPPSVQFLREDQQFPICGGQIECGMHGHRGTDAFRGSPQGLARLGRKVNIGHTHSAKIHEGVYVAGLSASLEPHYAKGRPKSWSHSHIVTYRSGQRQIITSWGDQWRG